MSSSRPSGSRTFTDDELARYLNDNGASDSDGESVPSETEDHLQFEDPEDTDEDDHESMEVIPTSSSNIESAVIVEESVSSQNPESTRDTCIIHLPQTVLRGKNRHIWSTKSCSRKTNRWPMCLFYGILNIAFVNSYVIYCENKLNAKEKPLNRKAFMRDLHTKLVNPFLEKRLSIPTLSKRLRESIQDLVPTNTGEGTSQQQDEPDPKKRKRCSLCSYKRNRMTKVKCMKCQKNICGEHKVEICVNCAKFE